MPPYLNPCGISMVPIQQRGVRGLGRGSRGGGGGIAWQLVGSIGFSPVMTIHQAAVLAPRFCVFMVAGIGTNTGGWQAAPLPEKSSSSGLVRRGIYVTGGLERMVQRSMGMLFP